MSDPSSLFGRDPDSTNVPPFETDDLRTQLTQFLDASFSDPSGVQVKIGDYQWGVYAFFDYDGEPIYVGQTKERVRTRIRRHLTNQRTDAVAMSVLDPFEVLDIEVWPIPELEGVDKRDKDAKAHLNALERLITEAAVEGSRFKAILNEKDPPVGTVAVTAPPSLRDRVVSDRVYELRRHPDFRIARRALIISRLAQVISEREVQGGLRRVLLTQAKRLQWLSERRYQALGGAASVPNESEDGAET
ncbi:MULTISPECIES: GIY-YIG nuclease family protein [unclassified Phenylobacterium]|uniref:GIY-YIG nuclease family protein n=1 Tax=unclassified Phenylobacterium TaxID=2640670 RepID=UPI00083B345F|nr:MULTISPECIES: GIY-YIG nuclease family protein [unclassified Phenylobacterium]